jgi:hypothetical protein
LGAKNIGNYKGNKVINYKLILKSVLLDQDLQPKNEITHLLRVRTSCGRLINARTGQNGLQF